MKLILRAADFGYTNTYNKGALKGIEMGVITSVDVMLDTPGTDDALEIIRNHPWISVGWHEHFWGTPVSDPSDVKSLIDENGRFKWRKNKSLYFEADYDEALHECRNQIEKCIKVLGKAPDVNNLVVPGPMGEALKTVCEEYGIKRNWAATFDRNTGQMIPPADEFLASNIVDLTGQEPFSMKVEEFDRYQPLEYMKTIPAMGYEVVHRGWHIGYLDDYIIGESSCTLPRVKDCADICSEDFQQLIIDNGIELINMRDALYGTKEFQNHLKAVKSSLYMGG